MDEQHERALRRQAVRLLLRGLPPRLILRQIPRGRTWLHKWQRRFQRLGGAGLRSQPRRPLHLRHAFSPRMRRLVLRARSLLEHRQIGLIGPAAIQQELRTAQVRGPLPSSATIKRILRQAGVTKPPLPARPRYFPQPTPGPHYQLHIMDWTERFLPGGAKVFAFHTIDAASRDITQTIGSNKAITTVRRHLLAVWTSMGMPDGLQMDNDAAFCGGYKVPRVFGQVVRLCLYLGIEPIFIPLGEAQRNGLVEQLNGLWSRSFWRRQRFSTLAQVSAASPAFEAWYAQEYRPPGLHGQTPGQAARQQERVCLTRQQARQVPQQLPITAGRVHFLRLVSQEGQITLLNESWPGGKRWAGRYVWATISTHEQQLRVYYRATDQAAVQLIKSWAYPLSEVVIPLGAEYRRPYRRRKMFTML